MLKQWRGAAYWLAVDGLLSLHSYRTQNHHPRNGTSHDGPGPSAIDHQLRKYLAADLMEAFSQLRFSPFKLL